MMAFKGVFFDLYGTLLIYGDAQAGWSDWLSAFYALASGRGLSVSKEAFAQRCDGFFGRAEPPPQDDGLTVYERRIQAFCVDLGLSLGNGDFREIADVTISAWQKRVSLDPDARVVLQTLKSHKTLALVSNYDHPPYVHRLLSELDLAQFFAAIVISGDVGVKKPDPRIFAHALRETHLQAQEVIYVGDSPAEDIEGAWAAGLYPVLVRRDQSAMGADFKSNPRSLTNSAGESPLGNVRTISRLSELIDVLENLE